MHRIDHSEFLLFIEPPVAEKLKTPIQDELTQLMRMALEKATPGTSNYSNLDSKATFREGSRFKGTHVTACGQRSANVDYLLENGMITNSLAPFYLEYYRYSIPESEMEKIKELALFYQTI